MARSGASNEDGLDLLLDTITNAFGGILFVALLVALMASKSKTSAPTPESNLDRQFEQELRQELSLLANEASSLASTARLYESMISPSQEGSKKEPVSAQQLVDRRSDLKEQKDQIENDIATLTARLDQSESRYRETEQSLYGAEEELRDLLAKELKLRKSKTQTQLPLAKKTSKIEAQYLVRYGRLYRVYNYNHRGRAGLNMADMVATKSTRTSALLTPNPLGGTPVEAEAFRETLSKGLRNTPRSRFYLAICVWEDSFDEFQMVKQAVIDLGYRYRLILCEEGSEVSMGNVRDVRAQ